MSRALDRLKLLGDEVAQAFEHFIWGSEVRPFVWKLETGPQMEDGDGL